MTYKNTNRRDDNEDSILSLWEQAGWLWRPMDRLRGFDGLLIHPGRGIVLIVENKNGERRWKLTPAEARLRELIGPLYHIVTCIEDARALIEEESKNVT
jgi:hypothetical protein